jgi:hypothetical protein
MTTILAGLVGGLVGVLGVLLGAWLNSQRENRKWLRDQKLLGAVEFLASTGQLYSFRRDADAEAEVGRDVEKEWLNRMALGRSYMHVLFNSDVVEMSDQLSRRVFNARTVNSDEQHSDTIELLNNLTQSIRREVESPQSWR